MSKTIVIGTIAIVLLAFALGGLFLWQMQPSPVLQQQPVQQTPPPPVPQSQTSDTSDFTLSEIEGWQTYSNEKYGYKLGYPDQFILRTESVPIVGGTNDAIGGTFGDIQGEVVVRSAPTVRFGLFSAIGFTAFPSVDSFEGSAQTLDEHVKFLTDMRNREDQVVKVTSNASYEKIIINGQVGYKTTYCGTDCSEWHTEVYFQNKNDDVLRFWYGNQDVCLQYEATACVKRGENTFADQILATFRFVESLEPSVVIISPNGGETWAMNSDQIVRWEVRNAPQDAKIALSITDVDGHVLVGISGASGTAIMRVPQATCGIGFDICLPLQPGNNFRATIELYAGASYCTHLCPPGTVPPTILATDESDSLFSIVQGQK